MSRSGVMLTALLLALPYSPVSGGDARAETVWSESLPEVLLCFPIPSRGTGGSPAPGEARMAQVLIGTDGFVREVRFAGVPPADSTVIASALRRWIFRPAQAPGSNGAIRAVPVWVSMPFPKMGGPWCRTRSLAPLAARPDSLLRSRMHSASSATAMRLQPPTSANFDSLRSRLDFVDRFAGSLVAETHTVDPKEHANSLLAAIDLALEQAGTDSLAAGCLPEPDFALRFAGTNRTNGTDVLVSLRCDFVQIRSPEATLLVPAHRVRDRLLALESSLFGTALD